MVPRAKSLICLAGLWCASTALAAPSGTTNAGVAMRSIESATRSERASDPRVTLPTRPPMNAPVGAFRIQLSRFTISGNTVFSDQSLSHLVGEIVGRRVSFADLLRAANVITNFYREAGYLIARAYVPEQEIQEGVVEIAILEGLIGEMEVSDSAGMTARSITKHVSAIKPGSIVSRKNVERALLLLNDLPGVAARATFKVGRTQGTSDLALDLESTGRFTGSLDANNYGNDFTGQGRVGGSFAINNLIGVGDTLGLRFLTSAGADTLYGNLSYSQAVGPLGMRAGFWLSNLATDIGGDFKVLNLESEADTRGVFISYPFVRSRPFNAYGQISLERRDVVQTFGGALAESNSRDEINVLSLSLSGDYRDRAGRGAVSTYGLAIQQGLKDFGNPFQPSRIGAKGRFDKYDVTYSRLQYFTDKISLLLKFAGQFSDDLLVSSEQFSLGGPNAVRAYVTGEGMADSALVASAELRRNIAFDSPLIQNAQLFVFYDYGQGKINGAPRGTKDNFDRNGFGIGLKLGTIGNYQLGFTFADALDSGATADDENQQYLFHAVKWFD